MLHGVVLIVDPVDEARAIRRKLQPQISPPDRWIKREINASVQDLPQYEVKY